MSFTRSRRCGSAQPTAYNDPTGSMVYYSRRESQHNLLLSGTGQGHEWGVQGQC